MDFTNAMVDCLANYRLELSQRPKVWKVSEGLGKKIKADGTMNDFYGATTVIKLSEQDKLRCLAVQQELFRRAPHLLVPIAPNMFHLTIHTLSNIYNVPGGNEGIQRDIMRREPQVLDTLDRIQSLYGNERLRLRMLGASTSGNDVVSIKFSPASEADRALLLDLFLRFEQVFPLHKRFTPHVTLGYFKLSGYTKPQIDQLYDALEAMSRVEHEEMELEVGQLTYQHHYNMNDFRDVIGMRRQGNAENHG